MKMRNTCVKILATLAAVSAILTSTGCMMSQAATKLHVEKEGLSVKYSSPKDQHVEYDPATGKIMVRSTSNEALVNAAGVAQAEAMSKAAGVLQTLADKVQ